MRAGTRNLFLTCNPCRGWRHGAITQQRTMQDFAHQMRWVVAEAYPDVPVVRVVLDYLNTHRRASLYEKFPAQGARRNAKWLGSTILPRTRAVWIWRRSSSASWQGPACTDATPVRTAWEDLSTSGCQNATPRQPPLTGTSPEINSADSIPAIPDLIQYYEDD